MLALQILSYVAIATAVIAILLKVIRYATAPEHMRWELYPVPHEKGRAEYGGSYLEEYDWWTKPRHTDTFNELKEMAEEILLLKGVFKHNRRVWVSSLPFHLGMYISIGWLGLLLIGALMQTFGGSVGPEAGTVGQIVHYLTIPCGYAGLALTGIGAIGLFLWRFGDTEQRKYNSPIEYFNLILLLALAVVGLIAQFTLDGDFAFMRGWVQSLATVSGGFSPGGLFTAELVLLALVLMYIPITRMSHFVAKYFLYHAVRWNDEPNERGSKLEKRLIALLGERVSWNGPHIQTGETWATVVKEPKHE